MCGTHGWSAATEPGQTSTVRNSRHSGAQRAQGPVTVPELAVLRVKSGASGCSAHQQRTSSGRARAHALRYDPDAVSCSISPTGVRTRRSHARGRQGPSAMKPAPAAQRLAGVEDRPRGLGWPMHCWCRSTGFVAASEHLPRERADSVAAVTSGLASTAAPRNCSTAGRVLQSVVEMQNGYLL